MDEYVAMYLAESDPDRAALAYNGYIKSHAQSFSSEVYTKKFGISLLVIYKKDSKWRFTQIYRGRWSDEDISDDVFGKSLLYMIPYAEKYYYRMMDTLPLLDTNPIANQSTDPNEGQEEE